MSNNARVNNDSTFLAMRAATSNMTVEQALEGIATDFQEYLVPNTHLVDYGPAMDGFSPTYKHIMPGCSQGNTVWMLRDFASFREAQGQHQVWKHTYEAVKRSKLCFVGHAGCIQIKKPSSWAFKRHNDENV